MICIWQTPPKIIRWRRWKRTEEWWRMGSHTVTDHRREEKDDQNVGLTVEYFTNEESCLLIIRRVTLTDKPGNGLAIWAGTSREKNIDEMNVPPKLEATKVVEQGTATDRGWLSSGKCEICSWCVWDCLLRSCHFLTSIGSNVEESPRQQSCARSTRPGVCCAADGRHPHRQVYLPRARPLWE